MKIIKSLVLLLIIFSSCYEYKSSVQITSAKDIEIFLIPFNFIPKHRVLIENFDKHYHVNLEVKSLNSHERNELKKIVDSLERSKLVKLMDARMKCILYLNSYKKKYIYISTTQHIKIGNYIYKPNEEFLRYFLKYFSNRYYPNSFVTNKGF